MVVHEWSKEIRRKTRRRPDGTPVIVQTERWVCVCGFTTCWSGNGVRARAQRDAHALDGQLAHDA